MQRICPTAQYCRDKADVKREKHGNIKKASNKRLFDWSFFVNHTTSLCLRGSTPPFQNWL